MRLVRFISTGFYSGLFPKAPGTFGSFVALILCFFLKLRWGEAFNFYYVALAIFIVIFGIPLCSYAEKFCFKEKDPKQVVVDEFAGMFIATAPIHVETLNLKVFLSFFAAFFFFRFFDILKPPPIPAIEKLPGGFGVMLDDAAAGLMAMLVVLWVEGGLLQRVVDGI